MIKSTMSFYFMDRVLTFRVVGFSARMRILSGPLPLEFQELSSNLTFPSLPIFFPSLVTNVLGTYQVPGPVTSAEGTAVSKS